MIECKSKDSFGKAELLNILRKDRGVLVMSEKNGKKLPLKNSVISVYSNIANAQAILLNIKRVESGLQKILSITLSFGMIN